MEFRWKALDSFRIVSLVYACLCCMCGFSWILCLFGTASDFAFVIATRRIFFREYFLGELVCVCVDEQWAFEFLSSWRILGSCLGAFCVHSFGVSGFPCLRNGLSGL